MQSRNLIFVICLSVLILAAGSRKSTAWTTVAYYQFDEKAAGATASGNGSILDSSGNGLHGTAINLPVYSSSLPTNVIPFTGRQNLTSLRFNGSNQRIFIPDNPLFQLTRSLTLEAYIYQTAQASWQGQILFRGDDRSNLDPYFLAVDSGNNIVFRIQDTSNTELISTPLPGFNKWYHLAATLDDTTGQMKLFVDGQLKSQLITSVRPLKTLDSGFLPGLGIGNVQSTTYSQFFPGFIDEVRISDTALSPDQFLNAAAVPEPSALANIFISASIIGLSASLRRIKAKAKMKK
jgi:hypothetical protein